MRPLVHAHFTTMEAVTQHGGVSLYRPRNLDRLDCVRPLNTLQPEDLLDRSARRHQSHRQSSTRALAHPERTACHLDNHTRAQLIDRITGPDSVVASFRDQFVVLAPAKTYVLSLELTSSGGM